MNHSQKSLAELLGVARPSLARTIGEMESERLFNWERNQVTILDLKAIQAVLGK
jgi:DNA-binding MarR family transcriptional regulator